ncbi:MAG: hypothetical protein Q8P71_01950 [bacterium]|nr:hypothetical protein [bacterium]
MKHKKTLGILLGLLVFFVVAVSPSSSVEAATIQLISPADGSMAGQNTIFQWESVGTGFYQLEINEIIVKSNIAEPSFALSRVEHVTFQDKGTYRWKVHGGCYLTPGKLVVCSHISNESTFTYSKSSIIEFRPPTSAKTLEDLLQVIMRFMFYMAIALAPLFYVVAGFILVVAGGNPDKVQLAKNIFLWTTIGFVVILIAAGLEMVIRDVLGVRQ